MVMVMMIMVVVVRLGYDYGLWSEDNDNDKDYVIWPAHKAEERILKILEKFRVIWPREILS